MNTCKLLPALFCALVSFKGFAQTASKTAVPGLPLVFLENKGQVTDQYHQPRKDIDFKISAGGMNVFFGSGQIHYQWAKDLQGGNSTLETYRMDVILDGANANAKAITENEQEYFERYYTPGLNGTIVHSFGKVIYKDIYPNIDWVLYAKDGKVEYDFVVHPGGDASKIKLRHEGATALAMESGALKSFTPQGYVTEQKPYSYIAETKETIASSFELKNNVLRINVKSNNKQTLVIDPILNWGTYYGSVSPGATGNGIATDAAGNAYFAGTTRIDNNFATFGAYQYTLNNSLSTNLYGDAYIVKLRVDGGVGVRAWCTYYGGAEDEDVTGIACDGTSYIYLAGTTKSQSSISTSTGSSNTIHQTYFGGGSANPPDAFLAKFDLGGGVQWATYYGGTSSDFATAVACDKSGNVYLGGKTSSTSPTTAIATSGAFQTSVTTPPCGFIAKFATNGSRQWGTYYNNMDITSLACDTSGNVLVGGITSCSSSCNLTQSAYQGSNGGSTDGVISKFTSGGSRIWSTYYGGSGDDIISSVNCDIWGNVYIGGNTSTSSGTAVATLGTYQGGGSDAFLAKFNSSGVRQWGTYYGGSGLDNIVRVIATPDGRIYVGGNTYSTSGIATTGAYKTTYSGPLSSPTVGDNFIARFGKFGNLLYGTYYGGTMEDQLTSMAYSDAGKLYFGGNTSSPLNIAIKGNSFADTSLSWPTAYIVQFQGDTNVYINKGIYTDTQICVGGSFTLPYNVLDTFRAGNSFTVQLSNSSGSFSSPVNIGNVTATKGGNIICTVPTNTTAGTGYRVRLIATAPIDTSYDDGVDIRVSPYPTPFAAAFTPICAGQKLHLYDAGSSPATTSFTWKTPGGFTIGFSTYDIPNVQFSDSGYYVLTGDNYGCITKDSVKAVVNYAPVKPTVTANGPVCSGDTLKVVASTTDTGVIWNWQKPQPPYFFYGVAGDTTIPSAAVTDSGWYKAFVALANGCLSDVDSVHVTVLQSVTPTVTLSANPGTQVQTGTQVTFSAMNVTNQGTNPTWQWMKNSFFIAGATSNTYTAIMDLDMHDKDTICVLMTSNAVCPRPVTVKDCKPVELVGVKDVPFASGVKLYPNPNSGRFTVEGNTVMSKEITVEVLNVVGQTVYSDKIKPVAGQFRKELNLDKNLNNGIYLLKLNGEGESRSLRFTLDR